MSQRLVGYGVSQVPTNGMLGGMAYQDPINVTVNNISVGSGTLTGTASQPLQVTGGAYVSGSFGIGTTNPGQKLSVEGAGTSNENVVRFNNQGNFASRIWLRNSTQSAYFSLSGTTADTFAAGCLAQSLSFGVGNDKPIQFWNGSSTPSVKMTIDSSGNVGIGTINPQYTLHVVGSFAATTKSFVITHPTKQNYKLQHGSLEGPENGVYVRGRTTENIIELPEYWTELVDKNSITVNLTPIGDNRVWIEEINNNKVYIDSNSDIDCFYTVFAERKDVEKLIVEIEEN